MAEWRQQSRPRVIWVAIGWQLLRLLAVGTQARTQVLGAEQYRLLARPTDALLFGMPAFLLANVVGLIFFAGVYLVTAVALDRRMKTAPQWLVWASGLAVLWNILRVIFIFGPWVYPVYSLLPLCFALWFQRQPTVRAYCGIEAPLARWQTLKVGKFPVDVLVGVIVAVGLLAATVASIVFLFSQFAGNPPIVP